MLEKNNLIQIIDQTLIEYSPSSMVKETLKNNPAIIQKPGKIKLFALGKASLSMTEGFCEIVGCDRIDAALIISHQVEKYQSKWPDHFNLCYSPHPLSNHYSLAAAEKAIQFFNNVDALDNLICLISGGGSSMMMKPVNGMTFDEKKHLIDHLIRQGIPEREVNEIRKSLSQVKGGKLLTYLPDMSVENIFLSDERRHKFDAISSGPTIKAHDHQADKVINNYHLSDQKLDDWIPLALEGNTPAPITSSITINNTICGTRSDVIEGLKANFLKNCGISDVFCEHDVIHSVAPEAACSIILNKLDTYRKSAGSGCHVMIIPAEIQVKADPMSKGGRNQHLTAMMMQRIDLNSTISFMAYATDGVDFMEGVAGAYFDNSMKSLIDEKKEKIDKAIATTSTYHLHNELGSLIKSEKTGHNVSDLIIIIFEKTDF